MADDPTARVRAWHRTEIIDIAPGAIWIRGYPIEQLIGAVSFPAMIWLMLRGEVPTPVQAKLLEAVLVSAVDHGPQAPAIAIARMAATCGVDINNAVASGVNVLGAVHGGAGTQCMELLQLLAHAQEQAGKEEGWLELSLATWQEKHGKFIPGYGHRFHPIDPRAVRLSTLVHEAQAAGTVSGRYLALGRQVEGKLARVGGKPVPMNIDGITAVVLLELGFPPGLGRSIFILSRTVGICAHAWEQSQQGGRIKGPTPPEFGFEYAGVPPRTLDESSEP